MPHRSAHFLSLIHIFNAMLMDSKDMPKVQIITDEKSIEKYGGDKMYFAPPIDLSLIHI